MYLRGHYKNSMTKIEGDGLAQDLIINAQCMRVRSITSVKMHQDGFFLYISLNVLKIKCQQMYLETS